jgi:glycosyltransferase involved in cell wall biosynthesis
MPRFSIVITCHNQNRFIAEAVSSALSQTFSDKEIIVVDDASTDGSVEILERYGYDIRLVKLQNNVGAAHARNVGAETAIGDYLVFLDGDDLLLPWALETYARILSHEQVPVIISTLLWFDGHAPKMQPEEFPTEIKFVSYETILTKDRPHRPSGSAIVVERLGFLRVHGWTNGMFPMEDIDILVKVSSLGRAAQVLSPPTTSYRVHANNSIHNVVPFLRELRGIIRKVNRGEYPCAGLYPLHSHAFLGGPTLYWSRRAFQRGFYLPALELLAAGSKMILAAMFCRLTVLLKGRQPIQTMWIAPPRVVPGRTLQHEVS